MVTTARWLKLLGLLAALTLALAACGQAPAAAPAPSPQVVERTVEQTVVVPATVVVTAAPQVTTLVVTPTPGAASAAPNPFRPTELFEVVEKLKAATQGKTPPAGAKYAFLTNNISPFWT